MDKKHRAAFAADPRFQARIGKAEASIESTASLVIGTKGSVKKPSAATARALKVKEGNKDGRRDFIVFNQAQGALTFVFPGAMLLSLNIMLRMHDAKASGLKATWQERIKAVVLENLPLIRQWRSQVVFPLIVEEVYITGESCLLDTEAVTASCKPIIDALVRNGIIPDDSINYLSQPLPYTERGPSPTLSIAFRPSPKPWGYIADETVMRAREASTKGQD